MASKKNKGLPFVVQPRLKPIIERLGTEESGIIEIERKGYLTVAEKSIVQGGMGDSSGVTEAFLVAKTIGKAAGVNAQQVFEDITSETAPDYLDDYTAEVAKVVSSLIAHEEKMRLITATTLIMTRVAPDWDPNDTVGLHPDLQAALYKLYLEEDQKSTAALEEAAERTDKGQEGAEGKA